MDPLTVLSLVGNIVQFVDFGGKLLSRAVELYKSPVGTLSAHHELELVTADLGALAAKLRQSSNPGGDSESADPDLTTQTESFELLCGEAVNVADELVKRLNTLKVKDGKLRKWRSLQHAIESAWTQKERDGLEKRLSSLKEALETRVLFSIRETLNAHKLQACARFDNLDRQTQNILLSMMDDRVNITSEISQELRDQLRAQTTVITQVLSRTESLNQDHHRQVRDAILRCVKGEIGALKAEGERKGALRKAGITEDEEKIKKDPLTICRCMELLSLGPVHQEKPINISSTTDAIVAGVEMLDVSDASERRLRAMVDNQICQSLRYPRMTDRYEEVVEAYPSTFEWAFHNPVEEQLPWSNLSYWLRRGTGMYWVNGKAGSGKSTFMKHIYDEKRTKRYLKTWAGGLPLCVATFFFWNSGTREQKSQAGLLRALLFQVLSQYPALSLMVLPETWAKLYSNSVNENCKSEDLAQFWSLRQLKTTFRTLLATTKDSLKICFMIDGLDEFEGDDEQHEELAYFFEDITKNKNVKACLSSRPWPVFNEIFGPCPNLRLQNLTYGDISHYVNDKLTRHHSFQRLSNQHPEAAQSITVEIVNKADGVFLWVRLVVRSLLNGIRNRDHLSDIWERLWSMPKELEPLYTRLLDLVEPQYLSWVSKAFQILQNSQKIGHNLFGESSAEREGVSPLNVQNFVLAIEEDITTKDFVPNTKALCEDVIIRLNARCAGLIEVSNVRNILGERQSGPDSLVRYFHRTARDFLEKDINFSKLLKDTKEDFDPNLAMMRSCLLSIQFFYDSWSSISQYNRTLTKDFMIYSYHADGHTKSHTLQAELLDKMNDTMNARTCWWTVDFILNSKGIPDFLKVCTVYGLRAYVSAKHPQQTKLLHSESTTALLRYLLPDDDSHAECKLPFPSIKMVSLLLELGADPNGRLASRSAWENTLGFFVNRKDAQEKFHSNFNPEEINYDQDSLELTYIQIMKILLGAGADPHALILDHQTDSTLRATDVVERIIVPKYPIEGASLLRGIQDAISPPVMEASRKRQRDENEQTWEGKPRPEKRNIPASG